MLNFNIKFVKSIKKQATTNMLNFKKKKNQLSYSELSSLKKYYYFNAFGEKSDLCSCFLLF